MVHSLPDQTLTSSPVALSATSIRACWVQVQPITFTGNIRMGDNLITATRGALVSNSGYQFYPTQANANAYDLSTIYVLSSVPGDTIAILYDTF